MTRKQMIELIKEFSCLCSKIECKNCVFLSENGCMFQMMRCPADWDLSFVKLPIVRGREYRHFKGGLYVVIDIVESAENGEELVIYRDNKTNKRYARKKTEFLEKLDKEKYPDAQQTYRFEEVL